MPPHPTANSFDGMRRHRRRKIFAAKIFAGDINSRTKNERRIAVDADFARSGESPPDLGDLIEYFTTCETVHEKTPTRCGLVGV